MITTTSLEELRKLLKNTKKPRMVEAQTTEFNRRALEYGNFEVLLNPTINQVLAKLATKKGIALGIDFAQIRLLTRKERALYLTHIRQLIQTSRKAQTKLALIHTQDERNARALLQSLGASSQQAAEALVF